MQLVVSRMLNRRAYAAFNRWLALVEENCASGRCWRGRWGASRVPAPRRRPEAWRDMVEARKAEVASSKSAGWRALMAERFMLAWAKRRRARCSYGGVCTRSSARGSVVLCRDVVARMQHGQLASFHEPLVSGNGKTSERAPPSRRSRARKTEAARDGVCVLRVERLDVRQAHVCRQGVGGGAVPDGVHTPHAVPRLQPLSPMPPRLSSCAPTAPRFHRLVHPEDDPKRLRVRVPRVGRARRGEAQGRSRGRAGAGPIRGQGEARRAVHPAVEAAEHRRRVFPVAHQRRACAARRARACSWLCRAC